MTPTQYRILEFIKDYWQRHGYAPSLMKIAQGIGIRSKSLVHRYVHALKQQGLLELTTQGNYQRAKLPMHTPLNLEVPLLGTIAAGQPIEAITDQDSLSISTLLSGEQRFALQVKGESMIDEGIHDGDIVICQKAMQAKAGDIVVALIDQHEATLKKIFYQQKNILLMPANSKMAPLVYAAERVQIQGIFVGLLRLPCAKL